MASQAAVPTGLDPYIVEAFTYLAICILLIAFRTYCRMKQAGFSGLGPDDYLMIAGILPFIAETIIAYKVGSVFHGLTNSDMTKEQRAALSPDSEEFRLRVGGSKAIIGGWSMYTTLIWMIKASMCAFYLRLTAGLSGYKRRVYAGFGGIVVSYLACMCVILFSCQPFHRQWQINPAPGNFCEPAVNKLTVNFSMYLNFITDLYLFFIPVPMLWGARLAKAKRIGLIALFSGGIVIMVFGFLRGVAILKSDATGPKEGAAWACRESFVAITTTNLPMTWGWIRERLRPYLGSLLSSNKSQSTKHNQRSGPQPGSIILHDVDNAWPSTSNNATVYSNNRSSRRDMLSHTGRPESDEESILPSNAVQGGILKEIELSVSTTKTLPETGGNQPKMGV